MNQYIITEEQLKDLETGYVYAQAYEVICIGKMVRSRPYQSERDTHWRDLFVSDLRSLITWDAEHGNPELFKAVVMLNKHYNTFSVEQHDKQVRDKVLDEYAKWENTWWTTHRIKEYKEELRRQGEQ